MFRSRVAGLLLICTQSLFLAPALNAATRTWTGAASSLWSNAGNWAEAAVPAAGDDLVFPSAASSFTAQNDLASANVFHSLTVNANYTISGNAIAVSNGITIASTATPTVQAQVFIEDNQTFSGGAGTVPITARIDGNHLVNCCYTPYTLTLAPGNELDVTLTGYGGAVVNTSGYSKLTLQPTIREGIFQWTPVGTVTVSGGSVEMAPSSSGIATNVTVQTTACGTTPCNTGLFLNNTEIGRLNATAGVVDPTPNDDPTLGSSAGELHLSGSAQYRVAISPTIKPRLFGRDYRTDALTPTPTAVRHLRAPLRIGGLYGYGAQIAQALQVGDGSVSLGGASLVVNDLSRFTACTVATILDSRMTTNAITGTFAGLAEGATVTAASGRQFRISYAGGNGNDITLTALDPALAHCPEVGHDFTADRQSDILWQNTSSGAGALWRMDGMTVLEQQPLDLGGDAHWKVAAAADFDGDGRTDILLRNDQTGDNRILRMVGATVVQTVDVNTVSDMNWTVAATGDLDGDGKADIIWRNTATGENYVYLMNGTALRSAGSIREVDTNWDIAGAGDLNHDGKADIVWRNHTTGEVYGWLMDGLVTTAGGSISTPDLHWKVRGVADFDGDGSADIFWYNDATGETWLYLMNGLGIASSGPVETVDDLDWSVVAVGDYNGDGRADVLWRNASTGENYIYLMDGSSIYTRGFLTGQPDLSWTVVR